MEHPADLDLAVLRALEEHADVADDAVVAALGIGQFDGEHDAVAVLGEAVHREALLEVLGRLLVVVHLPVEVAHDILDALVGVDVGRGRRRSGGAGADARSSSSSGLYGRPVTPWGASPAVVSSSRVLTVSSSEWVVRMRRFRRLRRRRLAAGGGCLRVGDVEPEEDVGRIDDGLCLAAAGQFTRPDRRCVQQHSGEVAQCGLGLLAGVAAPAGALDLRVEHVEHVLAQGDEGRGHRLLG